MKKLVFYILFLCYFSLSVTFAIDTVTYFNQLIDKKVAREDTLQKKQSFLNIFISLLDTPAFQNDPDHELFSQIRQHSFSLLKNLESGDSYEERSFSKENPLYHTQSWDITGIDPNIVRTTILQWHNEERSTADLLAYQYEPKFETSASIWAQYLRDQAITSNTHARNKGDGYYSYTSIMQWFANLGITFPELSGGRTAFSESVGYGYYQCEKSDCTNELIASIKTTRTNLIMKEKKSNGAHYRAVMMPHFTHLGFGISLDPTKKRYYLVLHYGIKPF